VSPPGSCDGKVSNLDADCKELGASISPGAKVKGEDDECLVEPPRNDRLDDLEEDLQPDSQRDAAEDNAEPDDAANLADARFEDDEDDEEDDDETDDPNRPRLWVDGAGLMDGKGGSQACIEEGMPCPLCLKQNKGIAACFAQGHLYLTQIGEVPSSCKDCKQRNKGALFCFKRGHMHDVIAMLGASSPNSDLSQPPAPPSGESAPSLESEATSAKMEEDTNAYQGGDRLDVDGDRDGDGGGDMSGDVSGPVSPQDQGT